MNDGSGAGIAARAAWSREWTPAPCAMPLSPLLALLAAASLDTAALDTATLDTATLDTAAPPPRRPATLARPHPVAAPRDTARPRAVTLSDGYARRAQVHRWGAWAMVPLLAAQWVLGERMYRQKQDVRTGARCEPIDGGLRAAHRAAAIGMGVVWGVNTVTGEFAGRAH